MKFRTLANPTLFELMIRLRRETGDQLRLLCVLTVALLIPVLLVSVALTLQKAAFNLEDRRHIRAFAADSSAIAILEKSLADNPKIERVTVLPAMDNFPAILEIKPDLSLTSAQTNSLAQELENSDAYSFVAVNQQLLQRNTGSYHKAKKLALVLFLLALLTAALACMVIIKRDIFRSGSATINLQRQLGATPTTISRPFIVRAALMTLLAIAVAAGLVTVFYILLKHYADISSYSTVLLDSVPVPHLIVLATVSVAAACFAAATALQGIYIVTIQILGLKKRSFYMTSQLKLIGN